jgi:hypothetical protein
MRPGHLGDLQDCWFGSLEGEYFEVLEERSADPIYIIRDRLYGKTGDEFKAYFRRGGRATTIIPRTKTRGPYPYQDRLFPGRFKQLISAQTKNSQIFKLY